MLITFGTISGVRCEAFGPWQGRWDERVGAHVASREFARAGTVPTGSGGSLYFDFHLS